MWDRILISMLAAVAPLHANSRALAIKQLFPYGSHDGRFGTVCSENQTITNGPICFVPFARLIANPERYDQKVISVTGFLVAYRNHVILSPSRESFTAGALYENVYIGGKLPAQLLPKLRQGIWVRVVGKFDATYDGPTLSLGAIWTTLYVALSEKEVQVRNGAAQKTR